MKSSKILVGIATGLLGAAAGVGIVVMLPIAGGVGAITLTGAAVSATLGGTAGAAGGAGASYSYEQAEKRGQQQGEGRAKAEYEYKFQEREQQFASRYEQDRGYFDLITALMTVGYAAAALNGEPSPADLQEIQEFAAGIAANQLPERIQELMAEIARNPPNVKTAYTAAAKLLPDHSDLFDEVIQLAMNADRPISTKETEFLACWRQLKA